MCPIPQVWIIHLCYSYVAQNFLKKIFPILQEWDTIFNHIYHLRHFFKESGLHTINMEHKLEPYLSNATFPNKKCFTYVKYGTSSWIILIICNISLKIAWLIQHAWDINSSHTCLAEDFLKKIFPIAQEWDTTLSHTYHLQDCTNTNMISNTKNMGFSHTPYISRGLGLV